MQKRIALINPGKSAQFDIHEPLNLGFIASFLEARGIEVRIIDELTGRSVEEEILRFMPEVAGITATTPFAKDAYRVAKLCRNKGILTVMGGVHASVMPEEALEHVDIVVKGEGEQAMLDIILGQRSEKIVSRPYIKNLDSIPHPAYHLMDMDFYSQAKSRAPYNTALIFVPEGYSIASMLTSRGCPYSCIFCHNTWKGMPFRANSPEWVVKGMRHLADTYKIKAITFFDDDFFAIRQRARRICELIKENKLNILWGVNARSDSVDLETLKAARDSGLRQVAFGFESGSQKILNTLNKGTTVEQNRRAVELCKQAGILCVAFFIIGNPNETLQDLELTRQFILQNDIDCIGLCIATPFPGTKLWNWCQDNKFIPEHIDWSTFSPESSWLRVSQFLSSHEVKRMRSKIFLDFALKGNSLRKFVKMSLQHPFPALKKALRIFKFR